MRTLFYSTKDFEKKYLVAASNNSDAAIFIENSLSLQTAVKSKGFDAVCVFPGDDVSAEVLEVLHSSGIRFVAVRASGYDNVDMAKAHELGIGVANVPEYSPYAIAEHALALILSLNRRIITAQQQVQKQDFTVDKLVGFDLHGKTIGIIGTGRIGTVFAKIMHGLGCRLLAYDVNENPELCKDYGVEYMDLPALCRKADIISLHTCLTSQTRHLINKKLIRLMQRGVMLINTSRGGCVDTAEVMAALEDGYIGFFGADVYEFEKGIFFYDHTGKDLKDRMLKKLLAMPNVLITPHQAFATGEALRNIATTTFYNLQCWKNRKPSGNEITFIPKPASV
jgi:D-lactate dehydrogenase